MSAGKSRHSDNIRRRSVHSAYRDRELSARNAHRGASNKQDDNAGGGGGDDDDGHVKVAVRCRPMSNKELSAGYETIVDFEHDQRIVVHDVSDTPSEQLGTKSGERRNVSHVYDFDCVFEPEASQEQVYNRVCKPIVRSALEGYNGTIFAYGQTGTGKTFTMEGLGQQYRRRSSVRDADGQPLASDNGSGRRDNRSVGRQATSRPVPSGRRRRDSSANSGSTSSRKSSLVAEQVNADQTTTTTTSDNDQLDPQQLKIQAGIIPRTFEQIFDHVAQHPEIQFLIRASYLEIYQEEIRDLLKKDKSVKLELHERQDVGVYVKDLTSFVCKSIGEIERVMRVGNQNRIVGATDMNEHSSRSHAIFMITIEQQSIISLDDERPESGNNVSTSANRKTTTTTIINNNNNNDNNRAVIRVGKLNLVDLAGSERQRKTNSSGQRQRESIKINLSLSALGNVINSLMKIQQQQQTIKSTNGGAAVDSSTASSSSAPIHTPYRESKLTRLLQDSLGGNAKTLMIANIGPASYNYDETINTLNYASRARCIKNRPKLNEDPKDALLRQLQQEIDLLRSKLAAIKQQQQQQQQPVGGAQSTTLTSQNDQQADQQQQQQKMAAASALSFGSEQSSGVSSAKSSNRSSARSTTTTNNKSPSIGHDLESAQGDNDRGGGGGGGGGDDKPVERELFELRQKLSSLESKLLNGDKRRASGSTTSCLAPDGQSFASSTTTGKPVVSSSSSPLDTNLLKGLTREQELELERRQGELANQVGRERAIRDELERREEVEMLAKQSFSSIQQEVDSKRRLIRQVLLKVKSLRDELDTQQAAHRIELDELDQLQYVLQKELKLKCLIMDNFVPNSHVDQLLTRVVYDDKRNLCFIDPLELATSDSCQLALGCEDRDHSASQAASAAGNSSLKWMNLEHFWRPTYDSIRPKCEFERISEAIYPTNIRFKYEELLEPKLEFNQQPSGPRKLSDKLRAEGHELPTANDGNGSGGAGGDRGNKLASFQEILNKALNQREPDIVI